MARAIPFNSFRGIDVLLVREAAECSGCCGSAVGSRAMPPAGDKPAKKTATRRAKKARAEPKSRGLAAADASMGAPPAALDKLAKQVESDGGAVLARYRDPLGGHWQLLATLPLEAVKPTPYQRDLSEPHVARLADRIGRLDRFLDPVIAYRKGDGEYWTPNGHHRTAAMHQLGARAITALVLPDEEIAFKILALNTEKAHNVKEKALEVIRMARALAEDPDTAARPESDFAVEFEEPAFLTLGLCYEKRPRFSGGAYQPMLRRVDRFQGARLAGALAARERLAERLLEIDDAVADAVKALKARGMDSPYLKPFVIARVNPVRFTPTGTGAAAPDLDETLEKMLAAARRFDAAKVRSDQVARAAGPPEE
jgi:ParB family chromosome partitioning protein